MDGTQLPTVHCVAPELQSTGDPATHAPAWHVSPSVHALPSLQAVPVRGVQVPFAVAPAALEQASQLPASHALLQQTPSAQKPLSQLAAAVHA